MKGIQLPAIETGELSALIGKLQDTYLLCVLLILYGIWIEKQPTKVEIGNYWMLNGFVRKLWNIKLLFKIEVS